MSGDINFGGRWIILDKEYDGELIYNKKNGVILLSIYYEDSCPFAWNNKQLIFSEIIGEINQKISCILCDCEVIKRNSLNLVNHHIVIRAKTLVFGTDIREKILIRNRVVYYKNDVTFELDNYSSPEVMFVVGIEGKKESVDKVYEELKGKINNKTDD